MVEQMKGRLLEGKRQLLDHHVNAVAKAAEINRSQQSISTNGNALHRPEPPKLLFVGKDTSHENADKSAEPWFHVHHVPLPNT